MSIGELLTRGTVWLAVAAWTFVCTCLIRRTRLSAARVVWAFGAGVFCLHVVCAFHFYHHWSHDEAYAETARQTRQLTGIDSGAGLYLNYAFAAIWVTDALWWTTAGTQRYIRRSAWILQSMHAFFAFMVVNGAIVFGTGPVRWFGAISVAIVSGAIAFRVSSRKSRQTQLHEPSDSAD